MKFLHCVKKLLLMRSEGKISKKLTSLKDYLRTHDTILHEFHLLLAFGPLVKVSGPISGTHLEWTPIFEWCVGEVWVKERTSKRHMFDHSL
jgi:hypothetical protein